jgi:Ferritin-like domain
MTSKTDHTREPHTSPSLRPHTERPGFAEDDVQTEWRRVVGRRSFLKGVGLAGAAAVPGSALFASEAMAQSSSAITNGDVAILRFLAAAELIESDLWQQYNELGGVNGGNPAYMAALSNLDSDMPQYIADNTDDELSHAAFLNAYLRSKGAEPVNLDEFRTLPSSKATGARQKGRLTNLQSLDVDTSWYVRYRSTKNPDLGASFPQAVTIRREPAIPLNDADTPPGLPAPVPPVGAQETRMQAIANTAGFHFAFIEQGGSSLYSIMALKASSLEVLRIIVSIGGVETNHFSLWHDKAGNAVAQPLAGVTDPQTGVTFPDLNAKGGELNQTNLILPEPCEFLRKSLPDCSIVRPTLDANGGAVAAIDGFTADRLFEGQSPKFFRTVRQLAREADAAQRQVH